MEFKVLRWLPYLSASGYQAARTSHLAGIEHFFACSDDLALDYIELAFHPPNEIHAEAVAELNEVFRQEESVSSLRHWS
jgi:hypothetical protein